MGTTTDLGRAVAFAAAGRPNHAGGVVAALGACAEWLTTPRDLLPGCPAVERQRLDLFALHAVAWAHPTVRPQVTAAPRVAWLDELHRSLADIDVRVFTALLAHTQAAYDEVVERVAVAMRAAVKDPARRAAMDPQHQPDDTVRSLADIKAALSVREQDIVDRVANSLARRAEPELEQALAATGAVLDDVVGSRTADEHADRRSQLVALALGYLTARFAALAGERLTNPAQPAEPLATSNRLIPADLIWSVLSIAGGAPVDAAGAPLLEAGTLATSVGVQGAGLAQGPLTTELVAGAVQDIAGQVRELAPGGAPAGREVRQQVEQWARVAGYRPQLVDSAALVAGGGVSVRVVRVWRHVTPPDRRFDPHYQLDGFRTDMDDRQVDSALRNHGSFPFVGQFYPGDHRGCRCRWDTEITLQPVEASR